MNSENKNYQIPAFTGENIPLKEAARIMGKDYEYVCLGMIEGIFPFSVAFKKRAQVSTFIVSILKSLGVSGMCTKGQKKRRSGLC